VTLSNATLVNKATLVITNNSIKESNPINLLTLACEESDTNNLSHFNIFLKVFDLLYLFPFLLFYENIIDKIPPIMTTEKRIIQNAFFPFDSFILLIVLKFYMCEKYGKFLGI